jgi:hypothetical protein
VSNHLVLPLCRFDTSVTAKEIRVMITAKKTVRSNPQRVPLPSQSGATTIQCDAQALLNRVHREAGRLSKELQRLRSESEELGERIAGGLETSRQEIVRLARRVKELELVVTQATPPRPRTQAPSWPSKSLFTFLGQPNLPGAH